MDIHRAGARLRTLQGHLPDQTQESSSSSTKISLHACDAEHSAGRSIVITSDEAADLIPDDACITFSGFVGTGCPEAVVAAIRRRFDASGHPARLELVQGVLVGDGRGRGQGQLAVEGLITRMVYAWCGLSPEFMHLIRAGKLDAWNLPFGVIAQMIRDAAAGRVGPVTRIGMGTYVEERGGKVTRPQQEDRVQRVVVGGRRLLWYRAPCIQVAVLRGTTADTSGNVSFEREAMLGDQLHQAMAAHNAGGLVIVQVERIVERGSLPPRLVHLPGALVDKMVVAPPEQHWQTLQSRLYDGSLSGEWRSPVSHIVALPLNERKAIAHRAMLEIDSPNAIINLGIGMPEGVGVMVRTHGEQAPAAASCTLSTEAGMMGGTPCSSLRFGAASNADAHITSTSMLDFYNGGGCDIAFLGCAEVDAAGNVNVSNFGGGRSPGCGGFIDISQCAKKVVFVGTLTSGGLKVSFRDGKLVIDKEGRHKKFVACVFEKTFAAAATGGRPVLYITERAVFRLRPGEGLELCEVAPGVDIETQILQQMAFKPIMNNVNVMDARIFHA